MSCSTEAPDRVDAQQLNSGEPYEAEAVFTEAAGTGGEAGGSEGVGAFGPIIPPGPSLYGDDAFEQYIAPPREGSQYCGDGAYDPELEECDDGVGTDLDTCSEACQTRDLLAVPAAPGGRVLSRRLGLGRHPISGGYLGGALTWVDASGPPQVVLQLRDVHGHRVQETVVADATLIAPDDSQPTLASNPVVATLPDGTHVVAYSDLNGDSSELGIALRSVSHLTGTLGGLQFANETVIGAQQDPDLLWTEDGLVVAWVDSSDTLSGPDLRYRIFGEDLEPQVPETALATTALPEGGVTLSTASGEAGWAAAWRRGEEDGTEAIVVSFAGEQISFTPEWNDTTGAAAGVPGSAGGEGSAWSEDKLMPGHMEDRLGLAPLGEDLLAVVFTVGTDPEETGVANVFRLWGAVVDFSQGEVVWIGPIAPLSAEAPDETHSQRSLTLTDASPPHLPGTAGKVFLGWCAEAALGDASGEELWLKRLDWDAAAGELILTEAEVSLARDEGSRPGDQRQPAFANIPVPGGHALAMAWEDWGVNFDSEDGSLLDPAEQARPDIVNQVAPVPLRRDPNRLLDCAYAACTIGQGPCEIDDDCAGGLVCGKERGPWYGYSPDVAVCTPPTCANGERDAGEIGVDCGGECGPCFECEDPSSSLGTAHYCSAVCRCENAEGDCDSDFDCEQSDTPTLDLACVESSGDQMGWPEPLDLCLRAQCTNGVKDADENLVDCGGPSCPPCLVSIAIDCTVTQPCQEGQGHCANNSECASGFSCASGQGELYGYSSGVSACVPTGCETGRGAAYSGTACSESCPCGAGAGQCASDDDCLGATNKCHSERGIYFRQDPNLSLCTPDHCFNGVMDTNETRVDCGGPCGRECPVCPGDFEFRSFAYDADSTSPVGERGWEIVTGSGVTWTKSLVAQNGSSSLEFGGSGTATLRSPSFSGSVFDVLGDEFLLDLALLDGGGALPAGIAQTSDLKIGIYHPTLGTTVLIDTAFVQSPSGNFARQSAPVPEALLEALALDQDGFQLEVRISMPVATTGPILRLDYVQLGGENAFFRSICQDDPVVGNPAEDLFGFEDPGLWYSAEYTPGSESVNIREGAAAVSVPAITHSLTSDVFELGSDAMSHLLLDVYVPASTNGATFGLTLYCPTLPSSVSDSHALSATQIGKWVTLPFDLSAAFPALDSGATGCTITINASPNSPNATALIYYDHLRFAPNTHCASAVQIDAAPFAIGSSSNGSAAAPYRLCTAQQIQWLMGQSSYWNKNYLLEADIDLTGVTGQIGNLTTMFTGTFDGQGHYLSNYSSIGTANQAGFFGVVYGDSLEDGVTDGLIANLTIADFIVEGANQVGSLAGFGVGMRARDIYVSGGTVKGTAGSVGGALGAAQQDSLIERTVSTAVVTATAGNYVGGLVGFINVAFVSDSRATGSVVSTGGGMGVGGLVGWTTGDAHWIKQSSASGTVTSTGIYAGGLVGLAQGVGQVVEDCSATGAISSTASGAGGLVGGLLYGAAVRRGTASGEVNGGNSSGGLVGSLLGSSVDSSRATGNVSGLSYVGGLIGQTNVHTLYPVSTVSKSAATGSVAGTGNHAGGLVGWCTSTSFTDVSATGNVEAGITAGTSAGGLIGSVADCSIVRGFGYGSVRESGTQVGTVTALKYDTGAGTSFTNTFGASEPNPGQLPVYNSATQAGVANLTAAQFRDESQFTNWDFFGVWEVGEDYPELRRSACELYEQIDQPPFLVGMSTPPNGTALHPYQLCNAAQLVHVMENPTEDYGGGPDLWDSIFVLESDIDFSSVDLNALTYGQIGTMSDRFRGTFNGAGHRIRGYSRSFAGDGAALFGRVQSDGVEDGSLDGVLENLVLEESEVSGTNYVAAAVGYSTGIVRNVTAIRPEITGSALYTGGLVGLSYGTIAGSEARDVQVTGGTGQTGGLAGHSALNAVVADCRVEGGLVQSNSSSVGGAIGYNAAIVLRTTTDVVVQGPSGEIIGGLVGLQSSSASYPGRVEDCHSHGPVNGKDTTGGLIGRLAGPDTVVSNSSAHGAVSGEDDVGGLVGQMYDATFIFDGFATGTVEASGVRGGGFVGYIWEAGTRISGSRATGKASANQYAGGFAGYSAAGSLIEDSKAEGFCIAAADSAGGFVGQVTGGAEVRDSQASGDAESLTSGNVGGFVGNLLSGRVSGSLALGDARGANSVGGFAGRILEGGEILDSSARGRVVGNNYAGGFAGYTRSNATLVDCAAYGDVAQQSGNYAGGLIGYTREYLGAGPLIDSCEASGNVVGASHYVGGLIGRLQFGSVQDSHAFGHAEGETNVGGLIGLVDTSSSVLRARSVGDILARSGSAGGLIGVLLNSTVTDSYAHGNATVSASATVGGFVASSTDSVVRRSYALGGVNGGSVRGSFLGSHLGGSVIEAAFSRPEATPDVTSPTGNSPILDAFITELTTEQFKEASHFTSAGWDFENTWQLGSNGPILRDGYCIKNEQLDVPPFVVVAEGEEAPTGGLDDPYVLCNASQIAALAASSDAALLGRHFRVAQSIPLGAVEGQIGDTTTPFTGTFDGGGYELFDYAPGALTNDAGLFGVVQGDGAIDGASDGHIHDVVLVDAVLSGTDRVGALVGHLKNGVVENVEIVDATVSGTTFVGGVVGLADQGSRFDGVKSSGQVASLSAGQSAGGLVGHLDGGVLWDSHSTADVGSAGSYAGGLLGRATDSALSICSAAGTVQATSYVGGLIGLSTNTSVTRCWATGATTATGSFAGGLLGASVDGLVNDAHATGNVGAVTTAAGGLIGDAQGTSVSRTYATGTVTGGGTTGGLIGTADGDLYLSGSFGSTSANGSLALVGNGTAQGSSYLTDEEFTDWSNFQEAGWEFGNIWGSGASGPTLQGGGSVESEPCLAHAQSDAAPFLLGMEEVPDGTAENPWPICSAVQFATVMGNASYWDDHFVLRADISLAGVVGQIGTSTAGFTGSFEGGGHTLSGYTANVAGNNVGLFARVGGTPPESARISNLKIVDFDVTGQNLVGALAGQVDAGSTLEDIEVASSTEVQGVQAVGIAVGRNAGTLARVSTSGDITGSVEVGGLVGLNYGGSIEECSSSAHVAGSVQSIGGLVGLSRTNGPQAQGGHIGKSTASGVVDGGASGAAVGGLVGYLYDGLVYGSSAGGAVDGGSYVGGLIGGLAYDAVTARVYGSSASGDVAGSQIVGGLIGGAVEGPAATARGVVERCSATGSAVATASTAGGLIGFVTDATIKDTWAGGNVSAPSYAGGLAGLAFSSEFINSYASGAVSGSGAGALIGSVGDAYLFNVFGSESQNGSLNLVGDDAGALGVAFAEDSDLESEAFLAAAGWDTEDVWEFTPSATLRDDGGELPFCERYTPTNEAPFISETDEAPVGTQNDPFKICTTEQLVSIANDVDLLSGHYELAAHINLYPFDDQIGTETTPFSGTISGNGYLLHDYVISGDGSETGLFGVVSGDGVSSGVIRGVNLSRFDVDGAGNVGTLVGVLSGGLLEAVQVRGSSVSGTYNNVGGLVGYTNGTIRDAGVDVSVSLTTGKVAGGVAGFNHGLIERVNSTGDVALTSTEGGTVRPIGGLVGEMTSGTIRDCFASGSVTSVGDRAGGMVGDLGGGELVDSLATGDVTIDGTYAGGLVGLLDSTVRNSRATGDVLAGTKRAGGLVGQAHNGAVIEDSHAYGDVECPLETGGLLGYLAASGANIHRSSAHGHVFGESEVGGLIGDGSNDTAGQGIVTDCYAEGVAFATNYRVGGLFGRADMLTVSSSYARNAVNGAPGGEAGAIAGINVSDTTTFAGVYYDEDTSNVATVGSGSATGISARGFSNIRTQATYSGWDFTNVWEMAFDGPRLRSEELPLEFCDAYGQSQSAPFTTGTGTAGSQANPYHVCTGAQLVVAMGSTTYWSKHFLLEADINMQGLSGKLGNTSTGFSGTFDGKRHQVVNYSNTGTASDVGLFGRVSGNGSTTGIVANIVMGDANISGASNVGAFVGRSVNGVLRDLIYSDSAVTGTGSSVGGIVGWSSGSIDGVWADGAVNGTGSASNVGGVVGYSLGSITGSISTSAVDLSGSGGARIGGLVGRAEGGMVSDSHAYGDVDSDVADTGGFVGEALANAQVQQCSASGDVTVTSSLTDTGGFVGQLVGGSQLLECWATGAVQGYRRVGGLVGYLASATVTDSFATGNASTSNVEVGGLVGYVATGAGTAIARSYSTGDATGTSRAGGLVGYMLAGTVVDSYATGDASSSDATGIAGGFIGTANAITVTDCYAFGQSDLSSGNTNSGSFFGTRTSSTVTTSYANSTANGSLPRVGASGTTTGITSRTTAQFAVQTNFSGSNGFDFTSVWVIDEAAGRPVHQ